jgi:hypothetical protein
MEVQTDAVPAANLVPVVTDAPISDSESISPREAAARFAQRRDEKPPQNRAPDGKFASSQEDNTAQAVEHDAPAEQTSVEADQQQDDPAERPSIDPPRSWPKEDHEFFRSLSPEAQQRVVDLDRNRELEIRKGQNEAAEIRKAAEAERTQAEQARQRYESSIADMLQTMQQNNPFADIKTDADVQKLANEDPFRFVQWQAHQQQVHALRVKAQELQDARIKEAQDAFNNYADEQDKLFLSEAKEFADPERADTARKEIVSYLTDVRGIPQDRLQRMYSGLETFSIRDASAQLIIRDAAKWHAAQKKATAAAQKPVPPVQRPGTAPSKADANAATVKALEQKIDQAPTLRGQLQAAAALRAAKRAQ